MSVTALVLCGGTSARLGVQDKTAVSIRGVLLLDRLIGELPAEWPVVCVGEPRRTVRPVQWIRETPARSGPLAGIAAGLTLVTTPSVVLLAGDQPFAGAVAETLSETLADQEPGVGAAVALVDGEPQFLLGAYRTQALRVVMPGAPQNRSVRRFLRLIFRVDVPVDAALAMDVDTPEDLERARER